MTGVTRTTARTHTHQTHATTSPQTTRTAQTQATPPAERAATFEATPSTGQATGGARTQVDPRIGTGTVMRAQTMMQAAVARSSTAVEIPDTQVDRFRWYSQFDRRVPGAGPTACFRAAEKMVADSGARVGPPEDRIQIGLAENKRGQVTRMDQAAAREGLSYIDNQLAAGKPVVVGVSDKDKNANVDRLTDHFVVVTGRGVDEQGKAYYTFRDPGTRHAERSTGRLYPNENGLLEGRSPYNPALNYDVSMVRRNAD